MSATGATTAITESLRDLGQWINQQEREAAPSEPYLSLVPGVGWTLVTDRTLEADLLRIYNRSHPYQSSDVTSPIEEMLKQLLAQRIVIPKPSEIRAYLLRYPDLVAILPSVCRTASERFSLKTQLSLEVYRDPEIEDEYLTLYVRQESYDERIMDSIEAVSAEYEAALADRSGWLLVTTDFRKPR